MNQDNLKLNGTHQLLFYADEVTIQGIRVYTIKKTTGALAVASKEFGRKKIANKIKYMFRDRNAGLSQNMKIGNSSL